ncbi:bifunctional diguanylate cyclase/phosphodiesterase [Thalassotalea atypica]|uniref:bifunctional diguanylate cyclase/phosphodiesterase n=1 Tax=Thalassotalea atypica TaxID=2054316 RepID=UPI0025739F54|nr:EAL domain-containing protein [Thalassotalea atypica]
MSASEKEDLNALRQLPKLKSLLKKYRQVKTKQKSLLQLSELASTVTELDTFYKSLVDIISALLTTDSLHISLVDDNRDLQMVFCHNNIETRLIERVEFSQWQKSLTGLVFLEQQPLHCSAAERMALAKQEKIVLYGSSCVDWLGIPLHRGHQIIGVIALQSYDEKHYFNDRDYELLEFIADHLVTAIDRVRSRELMEQCISQRTRKLTDTNRRLQEEIAERQKAENIHKALLAMSEIAATAKSNQELYRSIHHEVKNLIVADNFYIALKAEHSSDFEFPYYVDEGISHIDSKKRAEILTDLAIKTAKPLLIANEQLITLSEDGTISRMKYVLNYDRKNEPQTWLSAPLFDQDKVIGVIAIQDYFHADAYKESDLGLIRFIAQHIGTAIVRKRAQSLIEQSNEELERLVTERTQELQASNLNLRMQIEERRKAESQLYYEAHHDALTKLPNRAMFTDRLTHALRHIKRHSQHSFAVLFIDLDRFKVINDTLGHQAGDKFLIEIASRLTDCVRENDVLARLGGDEFVILLDSLASQDDVEDVATRIIESIEQPFEVDGNCLYSNASIGIALCNAHYRDASEILRDADAAMYQAKSLGRGRYVYFDDSMREQLLASLTLEQELRIAVKQQQFELHYQQISDLGLTNTIGFEALLRWQHPTKGLLTPSEFLFMAEETGLILDIERWIMEEVAYQLRQWSTHPQYNNAYIGVNLCGYYLSQPKQLNDLIDLIVQNKIEPQRLILEFNESAFMQQPELALRSLRRLKEFGVKLALDDYGAGMSSFNFLHSYPFEFIKLDRSFIKGLSSSEKQVSLVKALHDLGNNFGYRLVAEGIETQEMLDLLQLAGCEFGQGYFISRPCKMSSQEDDSKNYA